MRAVASAVLATLIGSTSAYAIDEGWTPQTGDDYVRAAWVLYDQTCGVSLELPESELTALLGADGADVGATVPLAALDRGRLAGPVRAQQCQGLADRDLQVEVVDRPDPVVLLHESRDLDGGSGHGRVRGRGRA